MSTTNEGNNINGIEGQGGVPYATYNDKVGLAQVIGIMAPRDIATYADGRAMHTGTKEVLARCGGDFGAMKDLTLPGGAAAGVWSYARPTDPEKQPEFYSSEMTEVPLNRYGMQGGIVMSGDWKIPTMTVIISSSSPPSVIGTRCTRRSTSCASSRTRAGWERSSRRSP